MIDIRTKLQASIFGNFADLIPNPDNITQLIDIFRDMALIPSTFNELNIQTGAPNTRIRLQATNNEWHINFASIRVDIIKNPINVHGSNVGNPDEFSVRCVEMFNRILNRFKKNVTRLAFVEEFLWSEKSENDLISIYSKLFIPTNFYKTNNPFEWNWRSVSRIPFSINGSEIQVNTITAIERVSALLKDETALKNIDRIKTTYDINTAHNVEYIFNKTAIEDFFTQVLPIRNNLLDQTTEVIDG